MLNCPKCQLRVSGRDLAAGVCSNCGIDLIDNNGIVAQSSKAPVDADAVPSKPSKKVRPPLGSLVAGGVTLQFRSLNFQNRDDRDQSEFLAYNSIQGPDSKSEKDSSSSEEGRGPQTIVSGSIDDVGSDTKHDSAEPAVDTPRKIDKTVLIDSENLGGSPRTAAIGADDTSDNRSSATVTQSLVIKTRLLVDSKAISSELSTSEQPEYELLSVLGVGGMGVVYSARQTSIDRMVALKMIKDDADKNPSRDSKFLAEAVVTGDLDHPNIVPIYDVGTNSQGQLFYSMKQVQGTPWMQVISKKSLSENIEILMRAADAVGFAHARGIVHRDLKPENIMLGEFGEVLVMDWGLAYPLGGYRKIDTVRVSKSMGGTPAYMSPEMATGPIEKIGTASDIYLLGAILYEIVTGFPPHSGKTAMKCLVAAAQNRIRPTDKTGELTDIAMKAMATEPTDRYPTVKDFQSAVREYQSHLESVLLSTRAEDDLNLASQSDDYQRFSRALFGFQEAYELWNGNKRAASGISSAKLAYAESAKRKGDFDLGLSLLDDSIPAHTILRVELIEARNERLSRQKRLEVLKRAAFGLVATMLVIVTGAALWIRSEQQQAIAEAERATKAEQIAISEKSKAESAAEKEKTAKLAAIAAEQEAVAQKTKAEESAKLEEKAKNAAISAEQVAVVEREKAESAKVKEEYESYISKIGLAASQIDKNAFDIAREVLDSCKPELRNWEWGRLMHLCSQSTRTYEANSPLEALAADRDGKRFATGGWNGTALIWDLETGEILQTLKHGGEYVNSVAFSPDGRFLATGSNDPNGYIQIWDTESGKCVSFLKGHDDDVLSVSYSKDGSRLLSSSYDKTARLWDIASGKEIRKFVGHTWWVWSAAFSADESRIITASQDGTSIVWDIGSEKRKPAFTGHRGPVFSALFSPDGKHAVTAGYDRRVLAWNPDEIQQFDFKNLSDNASASTNQFRAFEGHTGPVCTLGFSADGTLLLSGSYDNTVRVWAFDSTQALKTFRGHGGRIKSAAFLPDGQRILTASQDGTAREWSIPGYEEIRALHGRLLFGHADAVLDATFSGNQQQIVTASRDRTARTWNAVTGQPELTLSEGHSFLASTAIFFPDGRRLITAAVDNTTRIWDVSTGSQRFRLDHSGRSAAATLSHDAHWIATGSDNQSAQIWDATTGKRISNLQGHNVEVTSVAFSPNDRLLATGDARGHVKLWNREDGQIVANLDAHTRRISAIAFLPDGSRVLTASSDNTVAQWDLATGQELSHLILKHPDSILTMQLLPSGDSVVTSCADRIVRIWNIGEAKVERTIGALQSEIHSMNVSADGKRLLTANSEERAVRLWDLETGKEILSPQAGGKLGPIIDLKRRGGLLWSTAFLPGTENVLTVGGSDVRLWDSKTGREQISFSPHGTVASARFSSNGDLIVTGSWDNTAKIWDARTGRVVRKLENGHSSFINTAVFSPDGNFVLTGSDDATAKLWNVKSGAVVRSLEGHTDRVRAAEYSPDGKFIITASSDKTVKLWKADSGDFCREFHGHEWGVNCVDFSKDGKWIVTGSEDNTARVWNLETGECLLILSGHTASIASVAFSPDSMRIITGSQDQTAKLWDAKSGKEILTLSRHSEEVTTVAFSPDGRQILTGSRDGTAVIWLSQSWDDREGNAAQANFSEKSSPSKIMQSSKFMKKLRSF